jgi:hypothetical protein
MEGAAVSYESSSKEATLQGTPLNVTVSDHPPTLAETGFSREEIYDLSYPFNDEAVICGLYGLAEKIAPYAAEYDVIIGEGTSGRISALVMRSLINQQRAAQGMPPIKVHFLHGEPLTPAHFRGLPKGTEAGRSLVVTEYAHTGKTLLATCNDVNTLRPSTPIDVGAVGTSARAVRAICKEGLPEGSRVLATEANDTQLRERDNTPVSYRQTKGVERIADGTSVRRMQNFNTAVYLAVRRDIQKLATHFNEQLRGKTSSKNGV